MTVKVSVKVLDSKSYVEFKDIFVGSLSEYTSYLHALGSEYPSDEYSFRIEEIK